MLLHPFSEDLPLRLACLSSLFNRAASRCAAPRSECPRDVAQRSPLGSTVFHAACLHTGLVVAGIIFAGMGLLGACSATALAQASAAGVRAGDLQVGVGFTYARSDYGTPAYLRGGTFYSSFDFKPNFGVEVDFHQLNGPSGTAAYNLAGFDKIYQRDYEVGGRYVRHYNIFNPYARVMYGRGVFNYQADIANLAYNMGVIGGGVDINVQRHINVRADYEYQKWFGFHGQISDSNSSSLTPQLFTVGVAYHFE